MRRTHRLILASLAPAWLIIGPGCASHVPAQNASQQVARAAATGHAGATSGRGGAGSRVVHHYEYVFPDGAIYVYDMDAAQHQVARLDLALARGIRGVAVSPRTHTLYISYGGDGGSNGAGSMLAYDLLARRVLWQRSYHTGIDSMEVSRDGRRIYMPTGELDSTGVWNVLDARNGHTITTIKAGTGAHNTVVSLNGRHVYLGGRNHNYLDVADTATNRVIKTIGPLRDGVRPFTINGHETLAYTTATGFLGFQVSNIVSGRVLYTQTFPGYGWDPAAFGPSAPSHGISLSPDERQVWVMDAPNSYVHVFDVSRTPGRPPRLLANIRLSQSMSGDESPCAYDCVRDGWLQHSRNGRFVYVGDSGDVIDTHALKVVATLPSLRNSRKMLEIDWRGGLPIATSTREGLGYVTAHRR